MRELRSFRAARERHARRHLFRSRSLFRRKRGRALLSSGARARQHDLGLGQRCALQIHLDRSSPSAARAAVRPPAGCDPAQRSQTCSETAAGHGTRREGAAGQARRAWPQAPPRGSASDHAPGSRRRFRVRRTAPPAEANRVHVQRGHHRCHRQLAVRGGRSSRESSLQELGGSSRPHESSGSSQAIAPRRGEVRTAVGPSEYAGRPCAVPLAGVSVHARCARLPSRLAEIGKSPAAAELSRVREEGLDPRHADYDSACGNGRSPVNTGDSRRVCPGSTRRWTHLSSGVHALIAWRSVVWCRGL